VRVPQLEAAVLRFSHSLRKNPAAILRPPPPLLAYASAGAYSEAFLHPAAVSSV
jgi:hypothetical protein